MSTTATAHEVNHLDPIVIMKHSIGPLTTANDLAIEFNRNSRRGQLELSD